VVQGAVVQGAVVQGATCDGSGPRRAAHRAVGVRFLRPMQPIPVPGNSFPGSEPEEREWNLFECKHWMVFPAVDGGVSEPLDSLGFRRPLGSTKRADGSPSGLGNPELLDPGGVR
jgi:hypothetical protein